MKSSLQCFSRQQKGANIPDTYHLSIHVPKNENRPPSLSSTTHRPKVQHIAYIFMVIKEEEIKKKIWSASSSLTSEHVTHIL